jgi:hypothetical protein
MRTIKTLQILAFFGGVACGVMRAAAAAGEWRFPRGDLANTGSQPLPARISHPQVRGRFYVGGRVDGWLPGGVSLQGGDLVALDAQLRETWRVSFHDFYEILGRFDFDGDGGEEILAMGSEALTIVSLEGEVLWEQRFEGTLHSARVKVASLVPERRGLQLVVWPDRVAFGTAIRFDEGFAKAATLWRSVEVPETGAGYPPELVVADMNLDGVRDVALATFGKILVLDGATSRTPSRFISATTSSGGYPAPVSGTSTLRHNVAAFAKPSSKRIAVPNATRSGHTTSCKPRRSGTSDATFTRALCRVPSNRCSQRTSPSRLTIVSASLPIARISSPPSPSKSKRPKIS